MVKFRTAFHLPDRRVDNGEEGVGVFDDRVDMGHYEAVGVLYRLGVDLAAAYYETTGIPDQVGDDDRQSCGLVGLFEGRSDHNPFRSIKTPGNDDIRAFRERSADGLECLAAHDDRTARSRALEELQVFGNMPQEGVVPSYGIIVRYRYYYAFFHGYTATGAGIRGYGS